MCQKLLYSFCVVFAFSLLLFLGVRLLGDGTVMKQKRQSSKLGDCLFPVFTKRVIFLSLYYRE